MVESKRRRSASDWLARVPASFFGIVLGLVGFGSSWRTASEAWMLPSLSGELLSLSGVAVWLIITVLYGLKWVLAPAAALAEAEHAVQCCYVGLAGVATMLAGLALLPYSLLLTEVLFVTGFVFTFLFALWRTGRLWQGARDPSASTAVLYLPTVAGSFVTAIVLGTLGSREAGQLAFGAGFFSWLAIESVLLHRFYTLPEMTAALRPTLGIQLAPPAVGSVAYLSVIDSEPDVFVHALLGYAILQLAIILRLLPWILRQPFSASYWAFTFGLTSISTAGIRIASAGKDVIFEGLSVVLFVITNAGLIAICVGSILLLAQGRFLPATPIASVTSNDRV
ncbi:dicarboxylate transporter/tellurite-resistance protein TehA [Rhizobium sp. TRM95796]|nr:dicarboxylate transporter/tellurite-resistance protein TehA [Rhizobium sp. TRM95796]